jgi:hypothetical protein
MSASWALRSPRPRSRASQVGPGRRGYPPRVRAASGQCPAPVRCPRSGRHRWRGPSRTRPGHTTATAAAIVADTGIYHKRVRFNPAIRTVHRLAGSSTTCVASTPHAWPTDRPPGRTAPPLRGRLRQDKRPYQTSRAAPGQPLREGRGCGGTARSWSRRARAPTAIRPHAAESAGWRPGLHSGLHAASTGLGLRGRPVAAPHSRSSRRSGRNLRRGTSPLGRQDPHTVTLTWTDEFPAGATPAPGTSRTTPRHRTPPHRPRQDL